MDDIIRPKNMVAREEAKARASAAEETKKQEEELMMQAYASYLEDLKAKNPEEYKKVVDDMMEAARGGQMDGLKTPGGMIGRDGKKKRDTNSIPSKEITPKPGFVVKTRKQNAKEGVIGSKVFINICTHEAIKNFSKRVQLMEDGTEQEGLNVPCSVGPPRTETDKAGKPAIVFDVIVNPQVVKDSNDDVSGSTRHWLIEVAMDRIDNKYGTSLDRRYKLPKARYKGKVAAQRIRTVEKPKIEPVSKDDDKMTMKKKKKTEQKKKILPLEYCKYTLSYSDTMSSDPTGNNETENQGNGSWLVCPVPGEGSMPNPCASDLDLDVIPAQLRLSIPLSRLATISSINVDGDSCSGGKDRVDVEVSPWMVVVKAESYHAVEVMLPYPVFCEVEESIEEKKNSSPSSSFMDCIFDCEKRILHLIMTGLFYL